MKTKIVYVCTSTNQDFFLEQCWASAYSVKIYNPDAHIIILTNKETEENILTTDRKNILSVVDEIIAIEIPEEFNKMEQSRWLKTSARSHIQGDFLFIDCDTIITDDLRQIDSFDFSLGAVLDMHLPEHQHSAPQYVKDFARKIYNYTFKDNSPYINSGVLYVKDDSTAHRFFEAWHQNWLISRQNGYRTDQQSLSITVNQHNSITLLDGIWNAQPCISIQYLTEAKIVHFYNAYPGNNLRNPFFDKKREIYRPIKETASISPDMNHNIRHCRSLFVSPSLIVAGEDVTIFSSSAMVFLRYLYLSHHSLFSLFSRTCGAFMKLRKTLIGK